MTNITQIKGALSAVRVRYDGAFDVLKTFDCGQCFRFDRVENSEHEVEFSGVAHGKFISFAQDKDELYIYNTTEEEVERVWRHYLGLDVDYAAIDADLLSRCKSPDFAAALEYGKGIRILNQDPYEMTVSAIITQNNNIPRIKQIIERLSDACGEPVELPEGIEGHMSGRSSLHVFPSATSLFEYGEERLFAAKTGFRAKYIYDAVKKICDGDISPEEIRNISDTAEASDMLCTVKGIGPKVAACILLFGMEHYDAFPIDVWIKRAMGKYFPNGDFSHESFGPFAGIAQQYLFYYERYKVGNK